VAQNRDLVREALDVATDGLASVHQVHAASAGHLTAAPGTPHPQCDAMVTRTPGLALGILTADCQPVLFADRKNGVVAAAHAGWKGALAGIMEETLAAMERLGAARTSTTAVIGPSISQAAYEVGVDFRDGFLAADPSFARFFAPGKNDRFQFDLPGFGLDRLQAAGVGACLWTGHCTYSDPARFFSYRRTTHAQETDYGRLISAIVC
jgi:YfiH family protein